MASIMLVQTEDLLHLIAPIVWLKFGAVIALRYPTQPLTEAANTPTLSVLHFVKSDYAQLQPTYHVVARNFPNLRPPMAYTIIKDKKQVEHNFVTLIRARARCALPMPLEFHPVAWLRIPIRPDTGAVNQFPDWNETAIPWILTAIVQRLGGRRRGDAPSGLHHPYGCDLSIMYYGRVEHCVDTAHILRTTTC